MIRALRAYPTLLKIGVAEAVAYRAEFLVWMLSMTTPLIMMALWTQVAAEQPLGRFDEHAFVTYYLATLIVRQLASSWVFFEINQQVRDGTLGLRLLRPIHPLVSYSAENLGALPLRVVVAVPIAVGLLYAHGGAPRDPAMAGLFLLSMVGAWLINFSISSLIGALSLYLESAFGVWELWFGAFMVLSGYMIPVELFPAWLTRVARALPFGYQLALPVEILTGLRTHRGALVGLAAQWAWAGGFLVLLTLTWRRALKRFSAYGG